MKKTIKTWAMAALALALWSCSNSPSGVAKKAMGCMQDKDYKGYLELVDMGGKELTDEQKDEYASLLDNKASAELDKKDGIKSYEVTDETIAEDGKTATVKVTTVYGDGTEKTQDMKLKKNDDGDWKIDAGK